MSGPNLPESSFRPYPLEYHYSGYCIRVFPKRGQKKKNFGSSKERRGEERRLSESLVPTTVPGHRLRHTNSSSLTERGFVLHIDLFTSETRGKKTQSPESDEGPRVGTDLVQSTHRSPIVKFFFVPSKTTTCDTVLLPRLLTLLRD